MEHSRARGLLNEYLCSISGLKNALRSLFADAHGFDDRHIWIGLPEDICMGSRFVSGTRSFAALFMGA